MLRKAFQIERLTLSCPSSNGLLYLCYRDSLRLINLTLNKLLILPSYHGNE